MSFPYLPTPNIILTGMAVNVWLEANDGYEFKSTDSKTDVTASINGKTADAGKAYFDNENWATLWVKSSGADNERQIKLRRKPSTGEWFLNEIQCLSDVRPPASEDPWA